MEATSLKKKQKKLKIFKATSTLDNYLNDVDFTEIKSVADILLVGGKKFELSEFRNLSAVFKTGVGTDNLPFDEAKKLGIKIVLPSPETCNFIVRETSDFACHLILKGMYNNVSRWESWSKFNRKALSSKKLLVIGTGKIGSIVVEKMTNFCEVISFDILKNSYEELPSLIASADCVSLHLPLNKDTHKFIDAEKISWMKKDCVLVNTARGQIICEDSLFDALKNENIFAILDVFWQEPYNGKLKDICSERLIVTPHIASTCEQFLQGCANDLTALIKSS